MILLRIKGDGVIKNLEYSEESSIGELRNDLAKMANMDVKKMRILVGYPPRLLESPEENKVSSVVPYGEVLILEDNEPHQACAELNDDQESSSSSSSSEDSQINETFAIAFLPGGTLYRYIMPGNNCCLFTSVNFVMNEGIGDYIDSYYLREIIASTVAADKGRFTTAVLGKENDEYCAWILDDEHWGGAIELSILCSYFGHEIAVIDKQSKTVHRFGENFAFEKRVFLIYNGNHYDAVGFQSLPSEKLETIFPSDNVALWDKAAAIAQVPEMIEHELRYWVSECTECYKVFRSRLAVELHVQATGHKHYKQ